MFRFYGTWLLIFCLVLSDSLKPISGQEDDDYSNYGGNILCGVCNLGHNFFAKNNNKKSVLFWNMYTVKKGQHFKSNTQLVLLQYRSSKYTYYISHSLLEHNFILNGFE